MSLFSFSSILLTLRVVTEFSNIQQGSFLMWVCHHLLRWGPLGRNIEVQDQLCLLQFIKPFQLSIGFDYLWLVWYVRLSTRMLKVQIPSSSGRYLRCSVSLTFPGEFTYKINNYTNLHCWWEDWARRERTSHPLMPRLRLPPRLRYIL